MCMYLYEKNTTHIFSEYSVAYRYGDFVPQSEIGSNKLGGVKMQLTPNEFLFSIYYYNIIPIEHRVLHGKKLSVPHNQIISFELKEIPNPSIGQAIKGAPKNIIELEYIGANEKYCFARFEMMQFILPYKNHAECERLVHLMKANGVYDKFRKPDSSTSPKSISIADELLKLKNLVDIGVITPDEFEREKHKLLG